MKNKLVKKKQAPKLQPEQEEQQLKEQSEEEQIQDASFIPRALRKQALFVTFSGTVQHGLFQEEESLTAFCSIVYGPDWVKINGEKSMISQVAASNGKEITWNLPFEISFETTYVAGWPQIIIALYGTDFFGRSFIKGYGNMHLPTQSGTHSRRVKIFRPMPQSVISGIFGFIGGVVAQYKDYQKLLSSGEGREVTRVKSIGEVTINITTIKHNFSTYGYE